jgi:hypothetical protein
MDGWMDGEGWGRQEENRQTGRKVAGFNLDMLVHPISTVSLEKRYKKQAKYTQTGRQVHRVATVLY